MSDNVILLGAGASADAGIPLMSKFMDVMYRIRHSKRWATKTITVDDAKVLERALKARNLLNTYHGRAAIDPWNIEDLLSVLSFGDQEPLDRLTKAIGRVIDITCNVSPPSNLQTRTDGNDRCPHKTFWRVLIDWAVKRAKPIPPIVTLNYDLVLERALLDALIGSNLVPEHVAPSMGLKVCYHMKNKIDPCFSVHTGDFYVGTAGSTTSGIILQEYEHASPTNCREIEILKLHGSLNFTKASTSSTRPSNFNSLVQVVEEPVIIPPVFNKATSVLGDGLWSRALEVLRGCKNLIICGYSLPLTDTYMQYFLKAALGPNEELNRIFIFDINQFPENDGSDVGGDGADLRKRYEANFSTPIRKRIEFQPLVGGAKRVKPGSFHHLTRLLSENPDYLLFS